jgi:hypothetical protein
VPTFDEAKATLKAAHIEQGFRLVDEHQRELYFAIGQADRVHLFVSEEEIEEYRGIEDQIAAAQVSPVETSIVGPTFREQLVQIVAPLRAPIFSFRNRPIRFESEGGGTIVLVGPPSPMFINFFGLRKEQSAFLRERLDRALIGTGRTTMKEVFDRLLTIRLDAAESLNETQLREITSLFESCLFELSYMRSTPIQLQNEWPSFAARRRSFAPGRALGREPLLLKRVEYDVPALRFYQRGVATDDAYIQFISFYHVLEYYFISVSDDILYKRLSRVFVDPVFRPTPRHFDKIILTVEDHKRTNDETEMLKNVLSNYCDEKEIMEFIQNHELREKAKIYTEKADCFGEELEKLTMREGHIFGPVAKRIKVIRNTLVHSSDRYERKERYLPSPEADRVLRREVPLLRFLAERVVIATARALE